MDTEKLAEKTVAIELVDQQGGTVRFSCGFDTDGKFYETAAEYSNESEQGVTERAVFDGNLVIDGNGWRDIESGGYTEEFLADVLYGERDADEFLSNIAEALGVTGETGKVIS